MVLERIANPSQVKLFRVRIPVSPHGGNIMNEMQRYVVRDKRSGIYKVKTVGFTSTKWTKNRRKVQLFKNKGAAKKGMYSYNINPERGKIGAKIILPDWVEIVPVDMVLIFNK